MPGRSARRSCRSMTMGCSSASLTNETGARLANACLLHGQWGYRLGDLEPGQRIEIGPRAQRDSRQDDRRAPGSPAGWLESRRHGARRLLAGPGVAGRAAQRDDVLSKPSGGDGFAGLPNRYQAYCDLSRLARVGPGDPGRQRHRPRQPMDRSPRRTNRLAANRTASTVVYRFVLPLEN